MCGGLFIKPQKGVRKIPVKPHYILEEESFPLRVPSSPFPSLSPPRRMGSYLHNPQNVIGYFVITRLVSREDEAGADYCIRSRIPPLFWFAFIVHPMQGQIGFPHAGTNRLFADIFQLYLDIHCYISALQLVIL